MTWFGAIILSWNQFNFFVFVSRLRSPFPILNTIAVNFYTHFFPALVRGKVSNEFHFTRSSYFCKSNLHLRQPQLQVLPCPCHFSHRTLLRTKTLVQLTAQDLLRTRINLQCSLQSFRFMIHAKSQFESIHATQSSSKRSPRVSSEIWGTGFNFLSQGLNKAFSCKVVSRKRAQSTFETVISVGPRGDLSNCNVF